MDSNSTWTGYWISSVTVDVVCFDNSLAPVSIAAADVYAFQHLEDDAVIMSQGLVNSPKLTALEKQSEDSHSLIAQEKITKLKKQWMELTS